MNFKFRKKMQSAFTYIELILVIALLLILGTMGTAFSARFFTQNAVSNATDQLIGDFRQAQLNAMMGKQNSNWGVSFTSDTITLYQGSSYVTRTTAFDTTFSVNPSVAITGFSDLNFSRLTGVSSSTPTITISGTGESKIIAFNSEGIVTGSIASGPVNTPTPTATPIPTPISTPIPTATPTDTPIPTFTPTPTTAIICSTTTNKQCGYISSCSTNGAVCQCYDSNNPNNDKQYLCTSGSWTYKTDVNDLTCTIACP